MREVLLRGTPVTYAQLAADAGCTVRSVRNYLAHARDIFGFDVEHSRPKGSHSVLVRAVQQAIDEPSSSPVADPPTDDTLNRLLLRGSANQLERLADGACLLCTRGMPALGEYQAAAVSRWLSACNLTPRRPMHVRAVSCAGSHDDHALWPICVVMHHTEGPLLVGLPINADTPTQLLVIDAAMILDQPESLRPCDDAVTPLIDLASINVAALLGLPFGLRRNPADDEERMTDVHVRFDTSVAPRLTRRVWHPEQRAVLRTDGTLDVRFGPVRLDDAASWAAAFGDAIEVIGDKRLRKALRKASFRP